MITTFHSSPLEAAQLYPPTYATPLHASSRRTPPNLSTSNKSHAHVGGHARIAKPRSAANSPRSAMGLARGRSVLNEPMTRRRVAMIEEQAWAGQVNAPDMARPPPRSTRPLSWHPSSNHLAPQMYAHAVQPPSSTFYGYPTQTIYGTSPNSAVHSSYNSPVSAMSPMSLPYTDYDSPSGVPSTASYFPHSAYFPPEPPNPHVKSAVVHTSTTPYPSDSILGTHYDWNKFVTSGFNRTTDPPTPLNALPLHPATVLAADDTIPYEPLTRDDEDVGEELVGLGLYDKPKPRSLDSGMDTFQALAAPHLLRSRGANSESAGQGLKLEESWAPEEEDENGK